MPNYDVIVLGLGGMGSAALYHLAKRGVRVCGVEQFGIARDLGSSHGSTRIIRKAYFEHPDYIPVVERAYTLWRELEAESGAEVVQTSIGFGDEVAKTLLDWIAEDGVANATHRVTELLLRFLPLCCKAGMINVF